jgi:hypothetical protein
MLDIVGNVHMSLTDPSSIYLVGQDIHMLSCVASPNVVKELPDSDTALFHVVLKTSDFLFPSIIFHRDTQIFISGHLANPSPPILTLQPRIEVPSGGWMAHQGELEIPVEEEVQKAIVSGSVYVAGVIWNRRNQWNSYIKVVDCSLGKVNFLSFG